MRIFLFIPYLLSLLIFSAVSHASIAYGANSEILVFGASGRTGVETVKLLRSKNVSVTAFVRPTSNREVLEKLGVSFYVGDVMNPEDVHAAFTSGNFSAAIATLGCVRCTIDQKPDGKGNMNVTDAAKAAGVTRVIQISSTGVSKLKLSPVEDLKLMAENHLINSGLEYTIIRPGGLGGSNIPPATGNGILSEDRIFGRIGRADLALLIVQSLENNSTIGKLFHAIDRNKQRLPPEERP